MKVFTMVDDYENSKFMRSWLRKSHRKCKCDHEDRLYTNQSLTYITESCHLTVITRTQNLSDRTQIHGFGAEKRLQTGTFISLRGFRFLMTVYGEDLSDQNGQKHHSFRFDYEAK